jgi:MFS family permease
MGESAAARRLPKTRQITPGALKNQEAAGRWLALTLLAAALVMSMTTWLSAAAVIPQLRTEWSLTPSQSAWLTIAVQLGFVCGALLSGALNIADLLAPKHVVLGASIGAALANALLLTAGGVGAGIALRFATGFFLPGVYPPALKLMATWFRAGRGLALGVLVGAITVGQALPHFIGAVGGLDWRLVIAATSVLTLLGGLIVELSVKQGPYPFAAATFDPSQTWRVFQNRGVRLVAFGYFGHMWELVAMYSWFLVFFAASLSAHGIPVGSIAAYATFAVILMGAGGSVVGGVVADRWGRTRSTAWMLGCSAACCLLSGVLFAVSPWLLLGLGLLWGFSVVGDSAQFSTMVTELADQSYVGTALTLQLAMGFVLTVATIWILPLFAANAGWQWAPALLAPGPILGLAAMLRLKSVPESKKLAGGLG